MNKGIICLTAFLCVCLVGCRKSDPEPQLQGSIRFAIEEVKTRSNEQIFENVEQLAGGGMDGIAVVSAIFAADDIQTATGALKQKVSALLMSDHES